MEQDNITSESLTGGAAVASESSVEKETVSSVESEALSLKKLNEYLGKTYKDPESALKSIKDTFSYVGKKVEAKPAETSNNTDVAKQLKEMRDELFYSKNPQYESYRKTIAAMGESPAEVVAREEFKSVFEKATNYDKIQKSKTVLESNPRMGTVRSKQQEARAAVANRDYNSANKMAVDSVIEGLELGSN